MSAFASLLVGLSAAFLDTSSLVASEVLRAGDVITEANTELDARGDSENAEALFGREAVSYTHLLYGDMSSIVRKLIAASNGIPPSIVDWDELWAALTHEIELWVKDVFADGDAATIKDRWVVSGEMALDQLTNHMVSVSSATSGLCVIAMSDQCARAYAANRLGDDQNAMKSVSSLLLRLISEEPLSRLRAVSYTHL